MALDQHIYGPFSLAKLLNATIVDFSVSLGWSEQQSLFNCTLVNDPLQGDDYALDENKAGMLGGQLIGTPVSFSYSGFRFDGLIKQTSQINDPGQGNPIYKLTLVSPVEVLAATQVILAEYVGPVNDSIFNSTPQGGATFQVSNLLNVYGWAEQGGAAFGRSLTTQIGMPWNGTYGIKNGIETLTNTVPPPFGSTTNWGCNLSYRGHLYKVDLSNLPVPPNYYALGGMISMTLLELLSKFFQDAGVDYLVKLTMGEGFGPHTISFVTVPRYVQQQLGKIAKYIQGESNIATVTRGEELRADITQAFLVGGSLYFLEQIENGGISQAILPFFGFDVLGQPIVGRRPDGTQFADDDYTFNLNGSEIADILGEVGNGINVYPYNTEVGDTYIPNNSYPTNILELRCALVSFDSWGLYLTIYKPYLANLLNIQGAFDPINPGQAVSIVDLVNDSRGLANKLGTMFQNAHWPAVAQRLYEFVRNAAITYYGKMFIVKLPFQMQVKIDQFTGETSFSDEIADSGFSPEGNFILGLNFVNENFFLSDDGRFFPFVRMPYVSLFNSIGTLGNVGPGGELLPFPPKFVYANVAQINDNETVVQWEIIPDTTVVTNPNSNNTKIFSRCEQGVSAPVGMNGLLGGGNVFFIPDGLGFNVPCIVIRIANAVWGQAEDVLGSTQDLSAILNSAYSPQGVTQYPIPTDAFGVPRTLQNLIRARGTPVNLGIHPPAIYPNAVAVTFKSNQFVYGPWGQFSLNGKLEFEQDEGLVPWEYGSYDLMNQAAIAKLNTIAKGNQVLERGSWTEAGLPKASVGDVLVEGGPILTSVQCDVNPGGVTTSYSMETFVNRPGAFIFENQLLLQRIGKIYQQLRRTIRQSLLNSVVRTNALVENYKGFMFGTTYAVQQNSPHGAVVGNLFETPSGWSPMVAFQTFQETLSNIGVDDDGTFDDNVACVGLEALFRPYTYDIESNGLPVYFPPDPQYDTSKLVTSSGMNPLVAGCDQSWILSGPNQQYGGMRANRDSTKVDWASATSMALRTPIIQSWGFDIQGAPIPNNSNLVHISGFDDPIPNAYNELQQQGNQFFPNYLQKSIYWPTAPLDIRYDKFRGMWASPGYLICGMISGFMPPTGIMGPPWPGGTGAPPSPNFLNKIPNMIVYVNGQPTDESMFVTTHVGSIPPTGSKVICGYDPLGNRWIIISADCYPGN